MKLTTREVAILLAAVAWDVLVGTVAPLALAIAAAWSLVGCTPVYPTTTSARGLVYSWAVGPEWPDVDAVEAEFEALQGPGCWERASVGVQGDDFGCIGDPPRCHGNAYGAAGAGELPAAIVGNRGCACRSALAHELLHVQMLCAEGRDDAAHVDARWLLLPDSCDVCPEGAR